jgi:DNA-binding transcriptional ArsR family regulator
MKDIHYIEAAQEATALLKPFRLELLKRLDEPRTCVELADFFDQTPQKIYYHVKALEKAGVVEKVSERRVRGLVEGVYQARARSFWLAPHLVGAVGGQRAAQDQTSLRVLLSLAEDMQADISQLARASEAGQEVPSLSLSGEVYLPEAGRRAEFMREVQDLMQALARKYGLPGDAQTDEARGQSFRIVLACYPKRVASK